MTERKSKKVKTFFSSLRFKFLAIFLIAVSAGIGLYFLTHELAYSYIEEVYVSEENKKAREKEYIEDLQDFIDENKVTTEDTSSLSEWVRNNKYVYVIIYKNEEFFYTSDDLLNPPQQEPDDKPEQQPDKAPGDENEDPENPDEPLPEDPAENPDADTDNTENGSKPENDGNESDGKDDDKNQSSAGPGGVTIDYPTREELFEYAWKNDMHPLELSDGTIFVSLTDFTEYLYYDLTNIASISAALFLVLVVLAVYFHRVSSRIIRLGNEVNKVADGNIDHAVIAKGNDEISKLSVNVDNMRESMIENFKKEREALDANNALITSISHDIRTPLTVLLGYIDVMQGKVDNDPEMQSYLKAAESTAIRLKNLSDDMFGYFLVFGGKELEIKMERYDAATLIDQMLFEHITLMRESEYNVVFDGVDYDSLSGEEVRTDAQKLVRIFDNIFSNLYKYADKSCEITVSAKKHADKLVVSFSNFISKNANIAESNGIGLKTCKKLGEYINAEFEYTSEEEKFSASLTLQLLK